MIKNDIKKLVCWFGGVFLFICFLGLLVEPQRADKKIAEAGQSIASSQATEGEETKSEETARARKTMEEKQEVIEQDLPTMEALGLSYDYANMTLPQVIQAYMDDMGIESSQLAFSYKDLTSGQTYAMNDTQSMTAGSTYKLPLNMLVVDEVAAGKISLEERFDITNTSYEYKGEHDNYVAAFNGAMSIPDMQEYSLVYSENTPAYALAERLGGMDKAYSMFERYGRSKAKVKTISRENKTTTDYYIQVLEYLWNNQEKYKDILYFIGVSFPGEYYKRYLYDLTIYQKPGYVREALNVDAIVMEEKPYIVALYTAYLGGSTEASEEISGVGIDQVGQIAYIINEWHRVNMN